MLEAMLKLALAEVQKRPELIQEWVGKAVTWFLKQKAEREAEKEELTRLRDQIAKIRKGIAEGLPIHRLHGIVDPD